MTTVHLAKVGCCPGCRFCLGMAINCHRRKCRCGNPDQCPECNMTAEDGHREWCDLDDDSDTNTEIPAPIAKEPTS